MSRRRVKRVRVYRKPLEAFVSLDNQVRAIDQQLVRVQALHDRTKPENRAEVLETQRRLQEQRAALEVCRCNAVTAISDGVEASNFHPEAAAAAHCH